jgi:hypothetical protein
LPCRLQSGGALLDHAKLQIAGRADRRAGAQPRDEVPGS